MEIIQKTILNDEEYLRKTSIPVDFNSDMYQTNIELLREFCHEIQCFTLVAVQIGIPKRIIYLKNTTLDILLEDANYNESKILINPTVIIKKGKPSIGRHVLVV